MAHSFPTRRSSDPAGIPVLGEGAEHLLAVPPDAGMLARNGLVPRLFARVLGKREAAYLHSAKDDTIG